MGKRVVISSGAWQKDMEMTIVILDREKFDKECKDINNYFSNAAQRKRTHGSDVKAGLAMFASECFQQMAFNDFKSEDWLTEQFDHSKDKGIDGYPSMSDFGIKIESIDSWYLDANEMEISDL